MSDRALEVCVETPAGIAAAAAGGADRIELCAALAVGGLTPPASLVLHAAAGPLPVHLLCRPRAGGFVQDAADRALVADDIAAAAGAGLAGVVIGASCDDGRLDAATLAAWIDHAHALGRQRGRPLALTLHRAFDLVPDRDAALATAVALGFDRVLTSGGAVRAGDAADVLAALVRHAAGRLKILAAGGIDPAAMPALLAAGVREIHASCRAPLPPPPPSAATRLGFGEAHPPAADAATVRAMAGALRGSVIE